MHRRGLMQWSAGCPEKPSPRQRHGYRAKYLRVLKLGELRAELVDDQAWLTELLDGEHFETYVSQEENASFIVIKSARGCQYFRCVCHEVIAQVVTEIEMNCF